MLRLTVPAARFTWTSLAGLIGELVVGAPLPNVLCGSFGSLWTWRHVTSVSVYPGFASSATWSVTLPYSATHSCAATARSHATSNCGLVWPPASEKSGALGTGNELAMSGVHVNVGWNANVSLGFPPWLTLATWTLAWVARADCAKTARPSQAKAATVSRRVARKA